MSIRFFVLALLFMVPFGFLSGEATNPVVVDTAILPETSILQPVKKEDLIVAYYGHPNSRYMGILGRYSIPEIVERVKATAQKYQDLAPDRMVIPALYLIYGTAQPQGKIGYLKSGTTMEYIKYAADHGVHIILDHQIGTYSIKTAIDKILPYLEYPHVHLAFDVEWRTDRPMEVIGSITGAELSWLQEYVSDYLRVRQVQAHKYIVFHQFKPSMVRQAEQITTGFPQVEVIHSTSGWGPPAMKISTHAANARITQLPSKGFKLWYHYSDKPGIHFDQPLMSPENVMGLLPVPKMVIYQ